MHLIAQLLPGFAYNCPTVTTQFVTDIRLRYYLIPLQLWEKENKKMWDLKLCTSVCRTPRVAWIHGSISQSWQWRQLDCSRLQKGTLRKDLNVRPIRQGLSQRNHQTTVCGNKTGPLSEDNSGTEPRVQHLALLTGMLLALTSKWTGEWRSPMGKKHSKGLLKWILWVGHTFV